MNYLKNRTHSVARAQERYGVSLTSADIVEMEHMIQRGQSSIIGLQDNSRARHLVTYRETEFQVMYSTVRNMILTVLPPVRENKEPDRPCRRCRSCPPVYPNGYCRTCQAASNRRTYEKKLARKHGRRTCGVCGQSVLHGGMLSICKSCMERLRK